MPEENYEIHLLPELKTKQHFEDKGQNGCKPASCPPLLASSLALLPRSSLSRSACLVSEHSAAALLLEHAATSSACFKRISCSLECSSLRSLASSLCSGRDSTNGVICVCARVEWGRRRGEGEVGVERIG